MKKLINLKTCTTTPSPFSKSFYPAGRKASERAPVVIGALSWRPGTGVRRLKKTLEIKWCAACQMRDTKIWLKAFVLQRGSSLCLYSPIEYLKLVSLTNSRFDKTASAITWFFKNTSYCKAYFGITTWKWRYLITSLYTQINSERISVNFVSCFVWYHKSCVDLHVDKA